MRNRWWLAAAVVGGIGALAYFAMPAGVRDPLWPLFPLLSAGAAVAGVAVHRPARRGPTWALAAALVIMAAGDAVRLGGGSLDVASLCFFTGYVLLVVCSLWVTRIRLPDGDRAGLIDSLIVMVAIAAVLWDVISAPGLADARSAAQVVSLVAFPVLQAAVMASMIRILLAGAARNLTAWGFVIASAFTMVANVVMLTQGGDLTNPVAQALWSVTYVAIAVAGLHPHLPGMLAPAEQQVVRVSHARLLVLGFALASVPAVMLRTWQVEVQGLPVAVAASVLCIALVLQRIGLLLAERERALEQLRASWAELDRRADREAALAAEAHHRALHDALTGLPNRTWLMDRLERRTGTAAGLGLLFVDLDGFKAVNDRLGHHAGDEALVEAARRLTGCARSGDTLARLAGDEFVLVCDGLGEADARGVADRIVEAIAAPMVLGCGSEVALGASVGVAFLGAGQDGDALLRSADAAMYRAKRAGGGRVVLADA
jgi:diguanylate cyclase (GGDEF)-like protein